MKVDKNLRKNRRKLSIRNKIRGTGDRPRISVFRSNTNIYAQIIDDEAQKTLCSCSSMDKEVGLKGKCNKTTAVKVGEMLASRAVSKGIKSVVFDRNGFRYHGIVKELADAARKGGLEF